MFFNRLGADLLDMPRLDAEFYDPEKLRRLEWRRKWSNGMIPLKSLCDKITDGTHITPSYTEEGVRFLSSTNINCGSIDFDQTKFISQSAHIDFEKSNCNPNPGDILLAKNGKIGTAALYRSGYPACSLFVSVALLRYAGELDADYVVAFLNSAGGWDQFARSSKTGVITNLHLEEIREVEVPKCEEKVQRYIGDKMRQAERLRRTANAFEKRFYALILEAYPRIEETVQRILKHSRANPADLAGVLNPGAFNPDRLLIRDYLKSLNGLKIRDVATIETPVTSDYAPSDPYVGLDSIGSANGTIKPSSIAAEEVVGAVRVLSEGPVISKLRPYLNKVAYIPGELAAAVGSTELLCVRAHESSLNWYLCGVLQLRSTVRQLNPVSTGSTHPRVTREDILDAYVPWIDDAIHAGRFLEKAQCAYVAADQLVCAAKLLMEALISGQITADELLAAQSQMEQGVSIADQSILVRLCEGGIDAVGTKRVFPDVHAFYDALQLADSSGSDTEKLNE